jgi:hypothetical protein
MFCMHGLDDITLIIYFNFHRLLEGYSGVMIKKKTQREHCSYYSGGFYLTKAA